MKKAPHLTMRGLFIFNMARPERFELPTTWFVARYSIQLSYGRFDEKHFFLNLKDKNNYKILAEKEGFEPSMELSPILP